MVVRARCSLINIKSLKKVLTHAVITDKPFLFQRTEPLPMQIQNDLSGSTAISSTRTADTSTDTSSTSATRGAKPASTSAATSGAQGAQGASSAGSTGGDSLQEAAIKQLKALIESLQQKLSAVQQQMARAQQQANTDSTGAGAAMVASLSAQA